jgi:ferredoxin
MAYVIGPTCIGTTDRSCVEVCPVDCIVAATGDLMLFIDPGRCIDCAACVEPCPVEAIYAEDDLPSEWKDFARINRMYFEDRDGARALVEAWASRQ